MLRLILFVSLLCVCNILTLNVEKIVVHTTLGPVKGKLVHDKTTNVSYYSYQGIPYAEPPVGDLRFKPPVKKHAWQTIFDATRPGRVCPQTESFYSKEQMSEDCLNLNVYVPATRSKLLPVYVVLHAGFFDSKSGNAEPIYDPVLLLRNDFIVVSMNYRLGVLGFLSLCNEEVPGNAGIKDVVLALKIIHENIINFDGDRNRITIAGCGAGSVMAQMLMLTNQTIGLFQNVIAGGGSVLSSQYLQLYPRKNAMLLARKLGLDSSNYDCLLESLKNVDAFEFVKVQESISHEDPQRGYRNSSPFKPTVEVENESAIITRPPLELLNEGAIRDVPLFIGNNNLEGLEVVPVLKQEPQLITKFNKNPDLFIPRDIAYPPRSAERSTLAAEIKNFYFGNGTISSIYDQNYINLVSDVQYLYPNDLFVKLFVEKQHSPVYLYLFGGDTELNWFKAVSNISYPGAANCDGIGYLFFTEVTKRRYQNLNTIDKKLLDNVQQFMANSVYYRKPHPTWPVAGKSGTHMFIGNDVFTRHNQRPFPKRMTFWSSVYEKFFSSKKKYGSYFCTDDNIQSVQ